MVIRYRDLSTGQPFGTETLILGETENGTHSRLERRRAGVDLVWVEPMEARVRIEGDRPTASQ